MNTDTHPECGTAAATARSELRQSRQRAMNEPTVRTTVTRLFAALSALLFTAALAADIDRRGQDRRGRDDRHFCRVRSRKGHTIKVGDTIEWQNTGASLHSVDANPANAQKPTDVVLAKGAQPFDSGFMAPGAKYRHTFTVLGQYRYVCLSHEKERMRMFGYVTVKK